MTANDRKHDAWEQAYPRELREQEEKLHGQRHRRCRHHVDDTGTRRCRAHIGLALSGGGIRSATFAFGVLQTLARRHILDRIDVLSTVSGGGYTGALLTRLLARREFRDHDAVRRAILPACETPGQEPGPSEPERGSVLRWLRDNGRYLAPKGSGDLLLAGAILLRNWISVHLVLGAPVLTLFMIAQFLRHLSHAASSRGVDALPPGCASGINSLASLEAWLTCHLPLGETFLWWSPWVLLPALLFALWVVPSGWVYWLATGGNLKWHRVAALSFVVVSCVVYVHQIVGGAQAAAVALSWLVTILMLVLYCRGAEGHALQNRLSSRLRAALMVTGCLLAFALVDTFGQTVYALWRTPGSALTQWVATGLGGVGVAFASARWLAAYFWGEGRGPRVRSTLTLAAPVAAVLLLTLALVAINVVAHGVAWNFEYPREVPKALVERSESGGEGCATEPSSCTSLATLRCVDCVVLGQPDAARTGAAALLLLALTILIGDWRSLLNKSTLLPFYVARLTRAYLGASNPARLNPDRQSAVGHVHDGDDVDMVWGRVAGRQDPIMKGAPLHLVNVTINETLDGKLRLQQTGRKGIGMAIGPAGVSAGVRHHVVCTDEGGVSLFPEDGQRYRMFGYRNPWLLDFAEQSLSLGHWIGISGAAFSTGLGWRTNAAFSFLAGFFNVRLGFWWNSGVDPAEREKAGHEARERARMTGDAEHANERYEQDGDSPRLSWSSRFGRCFVSALPVHSYLLDEFLGRFHGTARRYWCLTDGGHFDNTGAYELIRRRLPLIVVIDAEADPNGTFQGLGTLVRKARADFGAEIEFLENSEQDSELATLRREVETAVPYAGMLDALRPRREEAPSGATAKERGRPAPAGRTGRSLAHAAVARVRYCGDPDRISLLVYVKPTLLGDEPVDIEQYHGENPDFPHQKTVDQFFDEAQWESYRKLGELIAERVLAGSAFEFFCEKARIPRPA